MNENKWIDNPRKMRWIMITKTKMVAIFNLQNSHLLTMSLPKEEVFQVKGQNRLVANLPVVDFHSQTWEILTPKPLNTQLSVFLLVYRFSFEPHCLTRGKNTKFFHVCCYGFSQGRKSLYNTAVYVINSNKRTS